MAKMLTAKTQYNKGKRRRCQREWVNKHLKINFWRWNSQISRATTAAIFKRQKEKHTKPYPEVHKEGVGSGDVSNKCNYLWSCDVSQYYDTWHTMTDPSAGRVATATASLIDGFVSHCHSHLDIIDRCTVTNELSLFGHWIQLNVYLTTGFCDIVLLMETVRVK